MTEKKALLLVGSPRGIEQSTSGRLGGRLLDALKERGFETDKLHVHAVVRSPTETERALAAVAWADLVVLSDRKSTRLNSSHSGESRMPSSA